MRATIGARAAYMVMWGLELEEDRLRVELERVYREQGAKLWRALAMYARDGEIASDALAEAFAQALRRGDQIRDPERWIWSAAFRIAAGELKGRQMRTPMIEEKSYDMPEDTAALLMALPQISPMQRRTIILHYYGGYSLAEMAAITGSTRAAIGVHLFRGRKRLGQLLEVKDD